METQNQDQIKETDYPNRRRPWIAVFLSLLMPGMGQIYCGDIVNGLALMLAVIMFSTFWLFGMIVERVRENTPMPVIMATWVFVLMATVVAVIDAYRRARRTRYDYKLKDFNRIGVYMALFWICGAGTFGYTAIVKLNLFEAFWVSSHSMAPTIQLGDRVIANKISYKSGEFEYGDVVLFKNPTKRKQSNIKRVVGLGGDTVEIKDGLLLINGKGLERQKINRKAYRIKNQQVEGEIFWEYNGNVRYKIFIADAVVDIKAQEADFGPVTVPDYHCFVMGDNRSYSFDSRNYGSLSIGALKGKLTRIYWPLQNQALLDARQ